MKTQTIPNASGYTTPQCVVHEIQPEGSLCVSLNLLRNGSSIDQLYEYESEYEW